MHPKFELMAVRFSCYITGLHTFVLERVCELCNLLFINKIANALLCGRSPGGLGEPR